MSGDEPSGTSLEARTQAFLAEFFNRGQELVRDLIEENEALRAQLQGAGAGQDPDGELVSRLRERISELAWPIASKALWQSAAAGWKW